MGKVTYNNANHVFYTSLKKAVEKHFAQAGIRKTGNIHLYSKSAIFIAAAVGIYLTLLLASLPLIIGIIVSVAFGFILACIGFNVMHDANHGSYSSRKWVNKTLGLTLNALGGNSFIWKQKHNIIHHTYTNIDGVDDDIAKSPFIRMCNTQCWVPAHRVQHLYTPFLYAISSLIWILFQDFQKYFKRRIVQTPLSHMTTADHVIFWISKVLYLLFYIGIPIAFLGWQTGLIYFLCIHVGLGLTLSVIFQLAHVVEETKFEYVGLDAKQIEDEWAVHQVKTTSNFSINSKFITWFAGGLNYQIEHHLFPKISHIHYPALSKLVQAECAAYHLPYNSLPSFTAAVYSHFRLIKRLGKQA